MAGFDDEIRSAAMAQARRQSPCGVDDLLPQFYGQDSPGNGCVQDCGPGVDIKTAIRAHWSTGVIDRGREQCPTSNTNEVIASGPLSPGVWVGRAWRNGL